MGLVSQVEADLAIDGTVKITWENPAGMVRARVLCRTMTYPRNINDGRVVIDDLTGLESVNDNAAYKGHINYYRVFWNDGTDWLVVPEGDLSDSGKIRVEEFYGWGGWLYKNLPEIYRILDAEQEPVLPLQRYLSVFGLELERFRNKFEALFDEKNPFEVDDDDLEALAWDVGWVVNNELPVMKRRTEISNAVYCYKRKGTGIGLVGLIEGLVGWEVDVFDPKRNILFTDVIGSTTFSDDPAEIPYMLTSRDTVDYYIGDGFYPWQITVTLYTTDDEIYILDRIRAKLERIFKYWVPICVEVIIRIVVRSETDVTGFSETHTDTLVMYQETVGFSEDTEYALELNWLMTDTAGKVTDSIWWMVI